MDFKSIILAAKSLLNKLEQFDEDGVSYYNLEEAKYLHKLINDYEKGSSKLHKAVPKPRYN